MPSPAAVVEAYFACMRHGDESVADLFHDDARLVGLGTVEGSRVGAEILIDLNDGTSLHVLDLFVVDDDRIRSLTYFVADHPPL